ncbi:MAG: exosortase-associated EpsI family protein [Chthoniobacterales bacterium]|nr:exosortase-associated EpsI family protein [Chthoniobacterales bacterium]
MTPVLIPWWRSSVVLALAALTIWLCRASTPPNIAPEVGVTMNLPTLVGEYWGTDEPVSPSELAILPADTEFAKKLYQDLTGDTLNAQIVLSGGEKRSIHRPEVCLPGQGWTIQSGEVLPITLANGRTLDVMKLTLTRTIDVAPGKQHTLKSYFLYWFVGKDTSTPYHLVRLAKTNWDMVVKKIQHRWAYVIVSATVLEGLRPGAKTDQQTLDMLQDFIRQAVPKFQISEMPEDERPQPSSAS